MTPILAVATLTTFVVLERLIPRRRQPVLRQRVLTDLLFFVGQTALWGAPVLAVLWAVHDFVGGSVPLSAPLWLKLALALLAGDLAVYWFHRACHRVPLLWRFHAVHHSSEHLDWLAAFREHPIDGLLTQVVLNLPAMLLDVPLGGLVGLVLFRGAWAIFIHSNVKVPVGFLKYLVGAPELHHWHHAKSGPLANFGNLSPWTDLLFGTFHAPPRDESWPLGVAEELPKTWWGGLIVAPLTASASSVVLAASLAIVSMSALAAPDGGVDVLFDRGAFLPATKSFGPMTPQPGGLGGLSFRADGGVLSGDGIPRVERAEEPTVMGSLGKDEISRVVRSHLPQIRECARVDAGMFEGKIGVKFTISPTGRVSSSTVTSSTVRASEVEQCLAQLTATFVFPRPRGGGIVIVNWPYLFRP